MLGWGLVVIAGIVGLFAAQDLSADGSRADVEMQAHAAIVLPTRFVYYGARDDSAQLGLRRCR